MTISDLNLDEPSQAREFLLFIARQIGISGLDGEIDQWDDLHVIATAKQAAEMDRCSKQMN